MKIAVTVGKNNSQQLLINAVQWSEELDLPYIERPSKGTLEQLLQENNLDALIVSTIKGPILHSKAGNLFFHPSMGLLRIANILKGKQDRLVQALGLKKSMKALDCTLGLGTDSLVMAYVAGKVVALEASKAIAFVIGQGMKEYQTQDSSFRQALGNIEIINIDAQTYLQTLPEKSFDVIYFDPMFEKTITTSSNIKPLAHLACKQPLNKETINLAIKVARKKVVVKVPHYKKHIDGIELKFTNDGKYSSVKYAVFEVENE